MPRVTHFEIPADDPERAARFYESVFEWKIEKWDGPEEYWLARTGEDSEPGINGAIMRRMEGATICNTIDVSSVDAYVEKIAASGGRVVMPRTPIPGIGYFAYCVDTEGNSFGIMQSDPSAR